TNHLDIYSKEVLKNALKDYQGTMIVISHDRDFLAGLTDKVVEFRNGEVYSYLGDINYFLQKRDLENMRAVELQKSTSGNVTTNASNALSSISYEEQKKLKKQVHQLEKEIATIEKQLEKLQSEMSQADFYVQSNHLDVISKHQELDELLLLKMEEWEECSEKLV
ncbi:MAG: ABC transporter ATP-binding protein, partial [Saprospiraceae bacterium]|nr:ABC transporter ATP-binding protein [Saprospiraceae bacterium]